MATPWPDKGDHELLALVQEGSHPAFAELVRYRKRLLHALEMEDFLSPQEPTLPTLSAGAALHEIGSLPQAYFAPTNQVARQLIVSFAVASSSAGA